MKNWTMKHALQNLAFALFFFSIVFAGKMFFLLADSTTFLGYVHIRSTLVEDVVFRSILAGMVGFFTRYIVNFVYGATGKVKDFVGGKGDKAAGGTC